MIRHCWYMLSTWCQEECERNLSIAGIQLFLTCNNILKKIEVYDNLERRDSRSVLSPTQSLRANSTITKKGGMMMPLVHQAIRLWKNKLWCWG
jgi:hypothetical protein